MSTNTTSLTPPANLAEVMERISSLQGLQRQRRDDLLSALRQIARLIGGVPVDIPAHPEALRRRLNVMSLSSVGMTKRRWGNVRALLTAALDLTGAKIVRQSPIVGLTPSWLALRSRVEDEYARWRLSRFISYASAEGLEPIGAAKRMEMARVSETASGPLPGRPVDRLAGVPASAAQEPSNDAA